jgi:hypothetical protein
MSYKVGWRWCRLTQLQNLQIIAAGPSPNLGLCSFARKAKWRPRSETPLKRRRKTKRRKRFQPESHRCIRIEKLPTRLFLAPKSRIRISDHCRAYNFHTESAPTPVGYHTGRIRRGGFEALQLICPVISRLPPFAPNQRAFKEDRGCSDCLGDCVANSQNG